MGIKGLSKLLAEHAPGCSMERKFQSYLDRKIAIDASMHIYQYLVRFTSRSKFQKFSRSSARARAPLTQRRFTSILRTHLTTLYSFFSFLLYSDGCRSLW
jgi:hypothetical protein